MLTLRVHPERPGIDAATVYPLFDFVAVLFAMTQFAHELTPGNVAVTEKLPAVSESSGAFLS